MPKADAGYDGALVVVYGDQLSAFLHKNTLIELVPVSKMFRDPEYASPLNVHKVNWYVEHWNPIRCMVVVLSFRDDGRFALIDGAHRHAAAESRGSPDFLPAMVLIDQTLEQEAELFRALNEDRRIPTRMDIFRAAWTAGDAKARGVRTTCQNAGFDVAVEGKGPNRIEAVGALETMWAKTASRGTSDILSIIAEAWGTDGTIKNALHGFVLLGLMAFWIRYADTPKFHRDELVSRLRASLPEIILGRSSKHRQQTNGLTPSMAVGKEILEAYNKGLPRSLRLPDWQNHFFSQAEREQARIRAERRRTPEGPFGGGPGPVRHPRAKVRTRE